jgi:hypothetical protein
MGETRLKILAKIKNARPDYSDQECEDYLETLELYCELVIKYTLKLEGLSKPEVSNEVK